jgi:chromosome segregation ATPase
LDKDCALRFANDF